MHVIYNIYGAYIYPVPSLAPSLPCMSSICGCRFWLPSWPVRVRCFVSDGNCSGEIPRGWIKAKSPVQTFFNAEGPHQAHTDHHRNPCERQTHQEIRGNFEVRSRSASSHTTRRNPLNAALIRGKSLVEYGFPFSMRSNNSATDSGSR